MSLRREQWLPHLVIGFVVLALCSDSVLLGRVYFERDLHLMWYAQAQGFERAVRAGSWPLWNPWIGFGQPMLANPNAQVLYPPTWLLLLLRPWTYYTLYVVLHLLGSGIGLHLLARRLGLSATSSTAAAALWTASGPLVSLINLWNHLAGAAWIPWMALAADRAAQRQRAADAVAWGAATAMAVVAGSAEMAVLGALAGALLSLRHLGPRHAPFPPAASRRWSASRTAFRMALTALGAAVIALALSAALWLPALEIAHRSLRWELPAEVRAFWSIHPLILVQALLPAFLHDLPLRPELRAALYESREPYLFSIYLGLLTPGFILAALAGPRRPERSLLLGLGALGLMLALGRHTPFFDAVVAVAPPLRLLRYPAKAMVLVALASSLLGGMGVEAVRAPGAVASGPRGALRAAVLAVLTLAVTAALALSIGRTAAGAVLAAVPGAPGLLPPVAAAVGMAALLAGAGLALAFLRPATRWLPALAVLDLVLAHRGLNRTGPAGMFTLRQPALGAVAQTDLRRLYCYEPRRAPWAEAVPEGRARLDPHLALRYAPNPYIPAAWGLFTSYDLDPLGIAPRPQFQLASLLVQSEGSPLHLRLLRLGAVSQVLAWNTWGLEDLSVTAGVPGPFPRPLRVLAVPAPLPRAYVVSQARRADGLEALERLADPGFFPPGEVVLSRDISPPQGSGPERHTAAAGAEPAEPPVGTVRIVDLAPDHVRLDAELARAGYVVLVDAFDPGWQTTVDGRDAPLLRANAAFRGLRVSAGHHLVEQRYRPRSVLAGALLSGVAWVAAAALLWARWREPDTRTETA